MAHEVVAQAASHLLLHLTTKPKMEKVLRKLVDIHRFDLHISYLVSLVPELLKRDNTQVKFTNIEQVKLVTED